MTRRTGLDTDFPKPTFMLRVKKRGHERLQYCMCTNQK